MASDEKRPSFWACAEEAEKRVSQWPAWKREAASATLVSRPEMRQARKEDHVSKRKPAITIVATVTEPALGGEAVIVRGRVGVFGRATVVHGDHGGVTARGDLAGQRGAAVEQAQHQKAEIAGAEPEAVRRGRVRQERLGDRGDGSTLDL